MQTKCDSLKFCQQYVRSILGGMI